MVIAAHAVYVLVMIAWKMADKGLARPTLYQVILIAGAFFVLLSNVPKAHSQISRKDSISITGRVKDGSIEGDSIFFNTGLINQKYFERPLLEAKVHGGTFEIETVAHTPSMYRILFASDRNKRMWRPGRYFIDKSTHSIIADYLREECNTVAGTTGEEFQNKFVPFMLGNGRKQNNQQSLEELATGRGGRYDSLLYSYISKYPGSYVALWHVIERFSINGHSSLLAQAVNLFLPVIKQEKIWKLLKVDIESALIKEQGKFPVFPVKTIELRDELLSLPHAKYILIDFWFSRCRPCLEAFPEINRLYLQYKPKGFEVVSISTDREEDIALWKKRIKEYTLHWTHFLDINSVEADKLPINTYPTTFVLDQNGIVIKKFITTGELATFLKDHFD